VSEHGPPHGAQMVTATDYHTAGEPFRIVTAGAPPIPGTDVRDRRESARTSDEIDRVRRLLCQEPRGHGDMYGCFLVPPDDDGAHLGVLFWHNDGYSTACGHGTIALGAWAVDTARVQAPTDGEVEVVLDVPSGRVVARVRRRSGRTVGVTFVSVPAYVLARDVRVRLPAGAAPSAGSPAAQGSWDEPSHLPADDGRTVAVDLAYGGAVYACLPASSVGLEVTPAQHDALRRVGMAVKDALGDAEVARHPLDDRLSGVYGTILYDDVGVPAGGDHPGGAGEAVRVLHQRNVTVFADGQIDRSPCGSGTAARLALLVADGHLGLGDALVHDSIVATRFLGRVVASTTADGRDAVVTEIEGTAFRTGEHEFVLDPTDTLGEGFVLR
jgi:proline racemase